MKRRLLDDRDIPFFVAVSGDTMTGGLNVPNVSANYIQINTATSFTSGFTPSAGTVSWNSDDKTVNIGLEGGSVLQVGEEELLYAVNQSGITITNGQVVKVTGSQGNRVVVSLAQATTSAQGQPFFAIATQSIANNQSGYFTRFGLVRDINTAAFNEGDLLWLSTSAGILTNVQPSKAYTQVPFAIVTRAHATVGTIMISPTVIPRLQSLAGIEITSAVNGNSLVYVSATDTWQNYGNAYGWEDSTIKFYQKEDIWDSTTTTVSANSASWGGGGVSDGKVKVTSGDTADYLGTKLIAGTGMTISVGTSAVTFTVDPPQDALQTFTIALATAQAGTFDGAYSHITGLYVPYNTTVDSMACYVTQSAASSGMYLAIYNSALELVCQTNSFAPSAVGVVSAPLMSACALTKNQRYYFYVGGSVNGCQLLAATGLYASNEPFLAKEDGNASTPPATFAGSSDSKRFWVIAYKS